VIWAIRYVPVPIKSSVLRALAIIVLPGTAFAVWIAQGQAYRRMTGVHILKNDQFFTTLSLIQYVAYFFLLFQLAKERREKEQASEQDKEHK